MNVNDIQSGTGTATTLVLQKTQRPTSTTGSDGGTKATGLGPVDTFISKPAEFFKKLQELITADPPKAQGMLSEVAEQLRTQAVQAGPGPRGDALNALATRFDKAAKTGDISVIKNAPPIPSGHGPISRAYASNQEPHALLELLNHDFPSPAGAKAKAKAG